MAAVLQTVVEDCRGTMRRLAVGHGPTRSTPDLLQARAYIASSDRTWPFSFENLCDVFDLEPDRLRRLLQVSRANRATPLRARRDVQRLVMAEPSLARAAALPKGACGPVAVPVQLVRARS